MKTRKSKQRTKKMYNDLFDNPDGLFENANVVIRPNGEPEIWVTSKDGKRGFRIQGGDGPAGLALRITRMGAITPPITVSGNNTWEAGPIKPSDANYVELCQYKTDPFSKAFKAWYTDPDNNPHPKTLGLEPSDVKPE